MLIISGSTSTSRYATIRVGYGSGYLSDLISYVWAGWVMLSY